ncbi:ABC-type multidrug transport system, ATPase component [Frankia canadensis]|uniref:ABC-type multidrug transport system, ATPase component n=1 Tax=Frankia canadensis TaxID=1836972 RepID=A0A2I2KJC4_9ACTN|nr:ATP-binding cassette domain-containing protein [Frankia canadensis]SNQ45771.1 ABC-type multidrug transport system, ATPase component [Frankia canadensis]SOU53061.1 ABC-type multidrug transport system, ATPase component [Frankia canadensis]
MIEVRNLSKRYGDRLAVDDLTFDLAPGEVTGFLGPNGSGKSTTLAMIVGLVRPTAGAARVHGRSYRDIPAPVHEVGVLLDARAAPGALRARRYLACLARAGGVATHRVEEVIDMVGLGAVADRRIGGFSLGMAQRLGIAAALLGDPGTLLLDEPVNGLDPEGISWVRTLLRRLAGEGRTIVVSSHLMSEMEDTADRVVVVGRGRLLANASVAEFTGSGLGGRVRVISPRAEELAALLRDAGAAVHRDGSGAVLVTGLSAAGVGDLAAARSIAVHELVQRRASLEEAYLAATRDAVEHRAATGPGAVGPAAVPSAGSPAAVGIPDRGEER